MSKTGYKQIYKIITNFVNPKPNITGLGRWSSTIKEHEKNKIWFHDSCNQDNCYVNTFKDTVADSIEENNQSVHKD